MEPLISFLLILIILVMIICIAFAMQYYNQFIDLSLAISQQIQKIRNFINQRETIIKKIKSMVTDVYNKHEASTFKEVIKERGGKGKASMVNAVVEAYPTLKANKNFYVLTDNILVVESRITDNKNTLVDLIVHWNTMVCKLPTIVIAKLFRFKKIDIKEVLEVECEQ